MHYHFQFHAYEKNIKQSALNTVKNGRGRKIKKKKGERGEDRKSNTFQLILSVDRITVYSHKPFYNA